MFYCKCVYNNVCYICQTKIQKCIYNCMTIKCYSDDEEINQFVINNEGILNII
jgi:hypothetical protein